MCGPLPVTCRIEFFVNCTVVNCLNCCLNVMIDTTDIFFFFSSPRFVRRRLAAGSRTCAFISALAHPRAQDVSEPPPVRPSVRPPGRRLSIHAIPRPHAIICCSPCPVLRLWCTPRPPESLSPQKHLDLSRPHEAPLLQQHPHPPTVDPPQLPKSTTPEPHRLAKSNRILTNPFSPLTHIFNRKWTPSLCVSLGCFRLMPSECLKPVCRSPNAGEGGVGVGDWREN